MFYGDGELMSHKTLQVIEISIGDCVKYQWWALIAFRIEEEEEK